MEDSINIKALREEISMLSKDQLVDLQGFVHHLQEIERLSFDDPKEYARIQIRRALENGF